MATDSLIPVTGTDTGVRYSLPRTTQRIRGRNLARPGDFNNSFAAEIIVARAGHRARVERRVFARSGYGIGDVRGDCIHTVSDSG